MKKYSILIAFLFFVMFDLQAQKTDSIFFIHLNQQIDDAVVLQDSNLLKKLYADDFVFSHGTGNVDNKASWLRSVAKGGFISRQHDSVKVELHAGVAILRGKLTVRKKAGDKMDEYFVRYVRLYARRNKQWQMVSHFSFYEEHKKSMGE